MPDKKLKGVKFAVEYLMPFAEEVIAGENENITGWFQYALKIINQLCRINIDLIPVCYVVV